MIRKESFVRIVQVMLKREVLATGTKAIKIISKTSRVHVYNVLTFDFVSRFVSPVYFIKYYAIWTRN